MTDKSPGNGHTQHVHVQHFGNSNQAANMAYSDMVSKSQRWAFLLGVKGMHSAADRTYPFAHAKWLDRDLQGL